MKSLNDGNCWFFTSLQNVKALVKHFLSNICCLFVKQCFIVSFGHGLIVNIACQLFDIGHTFLFCEKPKKCFWHFNKHFLGKSNAWRARSAFRQASLYTNLVKCKLGWHAWFWYGKINRCPIYSDMRLDNLNTVLVSLQERFVIMLFFSLWFFRFCGSTKVS